MAGRVVNLGVRQLSPRPSPIVLGLAGAGISQALYFVWLLLVARNLGSLASGAWNATSVFLLYSVVADAGAGLAMFTQLPRLFAIREYDVAARMQGNALLVVAGSALATSLVFAGATALGPTELGSVFASTSVCVPVHLIWSYAVNLARGHQRFGIVAVGLVARPAVLLLSSVVAFDFDYLGLVGSYALSCVAAASAVFVLLGFPGRTAPRLLISDLRRFLAVSVPVQIAIAGSWILLTADRLGILFAAGPATLGVWTLATLCSSVVWAIAPAVDQVLFAAFHETLALGKGPGSVAALADRGLSLVSLLVAVSVIVLQIALLPVVEHLLPGFRPGLGAARIYIMGSAFAMMVGIPARALQALGFNRPYTAIVTTGAMLIFAFTWLTIGAGASLSLVALVVSCVHLSVLVVVLVVFFRAVGADLPAVVRSSLRWAAAPSVALIVSVLAATLDES